MTEPTTCKQCGAPIEQPAVRGRPRRYCSPGCRLRHHRGQDGPADPARAHYAYRHAGTGGAGWCTACGEYHVHRMAR